MGLPGAGTVLTSQTVQDLVEGSRLHFLDQRRYVLKGAWKNIVCS
jgi:hypothetical protein